MANHSLTDSEAVDAVLSGRGDEYAVLVRRYQDVLYAHAVRMVWGADDAADLVQRAFVKGFERLGRCREPSRVGGWLFRILANECRDYLKSRRRTDVPVDRLPSLPDDEARPDDDLRQREMQQRLEAALDRLDPEQREAFVLKHVDGRPYHEMAALLDVSIPALKMRVHRARECLQTILEAYR
jgi:RNA polymerase sigma-70 factor (ECF subfamily)